MLLSAIFLALVEVCLSQVVISKFDDDIFLDQLRTDDDANPDEYLTAPQIIRRHGYASESHIVKTEDGYLLSMHRIAADKNGKPGKQPVLLQHGLLSSSADWLITGNKSLAFMLSDLGYDVWLGNGRGNTYSRAHVLYPPNSAQFWNFSFHEMGVYDLPAMLTHVSNVTGRGGDIIYVGHSMGTTMFFVLSTMLPEFTGKYVKMMVALAPVAYTTHVKSPIRYFAPWVKEISWLTKYLGIKEFLPNGKIMKFLSYNCELFKIDKAICEQVIFVICGFDKDQFDEKLLPVVLAHSPAGSSTKTIIHFAQEIHEDGKFMQFDYGENGNMIKYGNATPPLYDLTKINVPTYFMYAENDWLASPIDVERLSWKVRKNVGTYDVPLKTFNHVDFLWAKDAPKLVYENLIKVIGNYTDSSY